MIAVIAGLSYALRLRSAATSGRYGFEYDDATPYPRGLESYSANDGTSFTSERARDLKFTVDVDRPDAPDAGKPGDASEERRLFDAGVSDDRSAGEMGPDGLDARGLAHPTSSEPPC